MYLLLIASHLCYLIKYLVVFMTVVHTYFYIMFRVVFPTLVFRNEACHTEYIYTFRMIPE